MTKIDEINPVDTYIAQFPTAALIVFKYPIQAGCLFHPRHISRFSSVAARIRIRGIRFGH